MKKALVSLLIFAASAAANGLTPGPAHDPRVVLDRLVIPAGDYRLQWDSEHVWAASAQEAKVSDKADPRIKALPKFASDKPKFVLFRLDGRGPDGIVAAAIDESGGPGSGYDRAYVDCNRNWDLSDETPCFVNHYVILTTWDVDGGAAFLSADSAPAPRPSASNRPHESEWVKISSSGGHDAFVSLTAGNLHIPSLTSCTVTRRGDYRTTVPTNAGNVEVRVQDSNCDGVYGNSPGDTLELSGIHFPNSQPAGAQVPIHDAVTIGRRLVSVSAHGDKLSVEPYAGPVGTLKVFGRKTSGRTCFPNEITLTGAKTGTFDVLAPAGRAITLPAGSYKLEKCSLSVSGPKGEPVRVSCVFSKGAAKAVSAGKTTALTLGGNVTTALNTDAKSMVLTYGQSALWREIRLGDNLNVSTISTELPPPEIQFIDPAGRVAGSVEGKFT